MSRPLLHKPRLPLGHLLVFGWLPSPLKRWAYRTFLGYRIGRRVRFGFGGVVIGQTVELGDDVEIGMLALQHRHHELCVVPRDRDRRGREDP